MMRNAPVKSWDCVNALLIALPAEFTDFRVRRHGGNQGQLPGPFDSGASRYFAA